MFNPTLNIEIDLTKSIHAIFKSNLDFNRRKVIFNAYAGLNVVFWDNLYYNLITDMKGKSK